MINMLNLQQLTVHFYSILFIDCKKCLFDDDDISEQSLINSFCEKKTQQKIA